MAVKFLGFRVNGVLQPNMPKDLARLLIRLNAEIMGYEVEFLDESEPKQEHKPEDDSPAA